MPPLDEAHLNASPQSEASDPPLYRSSAAARLLGMPVATLRIWERRYGLRPAAVSPGGQRLYSQGDVERLALLKQLTASGHAIGRLAQLDSAQLRHVAALQQSPLAPSTGAQLAGPEKPPHWRLAVVGKAIAARLQRPAMLRRLGGALTILGPFESVGEAAHSPFDALLVHEAHLLEDASEALSAAAAAFGAMPKALLYGFAADAVCEALASAGFALLREPQPDVVLAQWLRGLFRGPGGRAAAAALAPEAAQPEPTLASEPVPPRRWSDAALGEFASLSTTIACECPRHVAELLVQLGHFEAYSAECADRSPADATLHAHLRQVASLSRAQFEAALEKVALHEGLALPQRGV